MQKRFVLSKLLNKILALGHGIATSIKKIYKKKLFAKNMLFLFGGIFILLGGVITIWLFSLKIPDFHSFETRKVENSTKIYDRTGEILLYDIHQNVKRTPVSFEEMGVNIKNATVAIEDSEFYNHNGVRVSSTIRAVLSNIFHIGIGGGGSTITQQLVKNTLLTPKKSPIRKIKEWVLAVKIDNSMPKEKILEYYLNEAPYGGTIYGIEEASRTYFGKDAVNLTLAEAAYLAAMPQSPSLLSPYGKNKDKLETRKNLVLSRMQDLKFISKEEYDAARNEVVTFSPQNTSGIKAPHFVFFIKSYLEEKYGIDAVESGGLKITSTLDYELEEKAEEIVKEGALLNEKNWDGSNAALVAIDPKTGQILSMVGSRDYFDQDIDGNFNVTTAVRQPGSSFKPFIYATAFSKGFTPDTVLFDVPTEFQTTCDAYGRARAGHSQNDCYMPDNYDGKFRGPIKLKDALAQSINVPAVQLFYLSGLRDSLKTAEDMGISTLTDIGRYGLTLVIGGGEVSLLDMTSAYGVFADNGVRNPYTGVLKVEDSSGRVLEEWSPEEAQVISKNAALIISDILSDDVARTPTFGPHSALYLPNKSVAVKTGTTNNNKDAWTIGYGPNIAVGVWAGNNDNKPMKKGGVAMAGPIWNKFMNEAFKKIDDEKFEEPDLEVDREKVKPVLRGVWQGNENFFIDRISGKLATEFTPKEDLVEKVVTNVHSILYWVDKKDITGPPPEDPGDDSQFDHWETAVQDWWNKNRGAYKIVSASERPILSDDIHTENSKPLISIVEPNDINVYPGNKKISLKISSFGLYPLKKIDVFINNIYLETVSAPFNFSFTPNNLENLGIENDLRIVGYDNFNNKGEATVRFTVE